MRNKGHYLGEVLHYIKSKDAKKVVEKELQYHLNQSQADWVSKGMTETEAEGEAVKQMGSPSELGKRFNKLYRPKIDWILIGLFIIAFAGGLLSLMTTQEQNFLVKQSIFIVIGFGIAVTMMFVDYRKLEKYGWGFLGIGMLILLALIFLPVSIAPLINGVPYILIFGFVISSMTALPFLFLFWAVYLSKEKPRLWIVISVYAVTVFLLLTIPNLPLVMIYTILVAVLFWRSALRRKTVYIVLASGLGFLASAFLLFWFTGNEYQKVRILAFLHPEKFQETHGYYYLKFRELITGGGWLGNTADPKNIPFLATDFAFVNITYYYGWLAAGLLVIVLTLLLSRMLFVLSQVKDRFGKQLLTGVCALFSIQFLYNIGMSLGLLPITSLSLPFISYGLTPAILNSFIIGIALSVYRRKDFHSLTH